MLLVHEQWCYSSLFIGGERKCWSIPLLFGCWFSGVLRRRAFIPGVCRSVLCVKGCIVRMSSRVSTISTQSAFCFVHVHLSLVAGFFVCYVFQHVREVLFCLECRACGCVILSASTMLCVFWWGVWWSMCDLFVALPPVRWLSRVRCLEYRLVLGETVCRLLQPLLWFGNLCYSNSWWRCLDRFFWISSVWHLVELFLDVAELVLDSRFDEEENYFVWIYLYYVLL